MKLMSANTKVIKVILAIEEVITAPLKCIYLTQKVILATDEVITACLKNISATAKMILATTSHL